MLVALAGGVGAARFLSGLVRAVPPARDRRHRQHRRRRRVPRPVRLSRPRLGHLHARRRVERRAGLGPRRRDVRDARRAAALRRRRPGSGSATRTSRRTSSAPQRLRAGATLSEVTGEIARAWGLEVRLLPMTDDRGAHPDHRARGRTAHRARSAMQEWFVGERAEPPVVAVRFDGAEAARPAPGVLDALRDGRQRSSICPSNPVISIGPILAVPGIRDALARPPGPRRRGQPDRRRRAGEGTGRPAHGPARHRGVVRRRRPGVRRVLRHARDRRGRRATSRPAVEAAGVRAVVTDTMMRSPEIAAELARQHARGRRLIGSWPRRCTIIPIAGIGEIRPGDEIADADRSTPPPRRARPLVDRRLPRRDPEGRVEGRRPTRRRSTRDDLDARRRLVESESVRIVRRRGDLMISETRARLRVRERGHRPVERRSRVTPRCCRSTPTARPSTSATRSRARAGVDVAVIVSDTFGRPWRQRAHRRRDRRERHRGGRRPARDARRARPRCCTSPKSRSPTRSRPRPSS